MPILQTLFVPNRLNVMYSSQPFNIAKQRLDMRSAQYYDVRRQQVSPQNTTPGGVSDRYLTSDYADHESQVTLRQGLYLHWSVTDALATMRQSPLTGDGLAFPRVPNRWLVTRTNVNTRESSHWIIESDYLSEPVRGAEQEMAFAPQPQVDADPDSPTSASYTQFPITLAAQMARVLAGEVSAPPDAIYPYRFMGRQVPWAAWDAYAGSGHTYLSDMLPSGLTVVGYGEPTFAAVFANSRTVFGFHDLTADRETPYRYDVVGWYADPADDCLQNFWQMPGAQTDADRFAALASEYHWQVEGTDGAVFPSRTVLYSSLQVTPKDIDEVGTAAAQTISVDLAVGNTGSEALASYLAATITDNDSDKQMVEARLDALPLLHHLHGAQVDVGRRLQQLRHQRGFKGQHAGRLWAVRPATESSSAQRASQMPTSLPPVVPLPDSFASALNRLNRAQDAYDRLQNVIADWQHRLFADWYKYDLSFYAEPQVTAWDCFVYQRQLAKYRAGGATNLNAHLPNPNVARQYLREEMIEMLYLLAEAGQVQMDADGFPSAAVTFALPMPVKMTFQYDTELIADLTKISEQSLALRLVSAFQDAQVECAAYNADNPPVALVAEGAPRYWQPAEPFVVAAAQHGGALPGLTHLYGHDGTLSCALYGLNRSDMGAPLGQPDLKTLSAFAQSLIPSPEVRASVDRGLVMLEWGANIRAVLAQPNGEVLAGTRPNPSGAGVDFLPDYLTANFNLPEGALDLQLNEESAVSPTVSSFSGNVVLTDYASVQLVEAMQRYLTGVTLVDLKDRAPDTDNSQLAAWYVGQHPDAVPPPPPAADDSVWDAWLGAQYPFRTADGDYPVGQDVWAWYQTCPAYSPDNLTGDPSAVYLKSLDAARRMNAIGQALGGFNNALLMREQVLQLPIFDMGMVFPDFRSTIHPESAYDFVMAVAALVGGGNRSAPNANGYFQPIRSGDMSLTTLTLLDSFGRVYTLEPTTVQPSTSLTRPDWDSSISPLAPIYLPPRLAQPSRAVFRWLSATDDGEELNIRPAASPVCGWLMPNTLEGGLMVFDADGAALGSINVLAGWEAAPGADVPMDAGQIPNLHLRAVVNKLIVNAETTDDEAEALTVYLGSFIAALNSSMARIEPEDFAQHTSTALMVGRPVAVVRARAGVEFMGIPQVNQSFAAYLSTLYEARECFTLPDVDPFNNPLTNHYESVRMTLRVGERQHYNDGLVGYWKEADDGRLSDVFYAPKAAPAFINPAVIWSAPSDDDSGDGDGEEGEYIPDSRPSPTIAVVSDPDQPTNVLDVNPLDEPYTLTMLVDPRGVIHATTGLLPVKAIGIPSDQYSPALRNMAATFLVAPILTAAQQPTLPLPTVPGGAWSWVSHPDASTWAVVSATTPSDPVSDTPAQIGSASEAAVFNPQRLVEGWLRLSRAEEPTEESPS